MYLFAQRICDVKSLCHIYYTLNYTSNLLACVFIFHTHSENNATFCICVFPREGARCSSVVRAFAHSAMGRWTDPSWNGPIELFLILASAPRSCLWDDAYQRTLAANRKE